MFYCHIGVSFFFEYQISHGGILILPLQMKNTNTKSSYSWDILQQNTELFTIDETFLNLNH